MCSLQEEKKTRRGKTKDKNGKNVTPLFDCEKIAEKITRDEIRRIKLRLNVKTKMPKICVNSLRRGQEVLGVYMR
jgi:hypothetical protein